jgi:hypothetical protein
VDVVHHRCADASEAISLRISFSPHLSV